ncbi:MAG TPA: metal-dependent hydrolase [Magnetospirillum sp.]|nr:metal-dependent hydrolase [Magnetospirillum sp.]
MPTILTHPALAIAARLGLGKVIPARLAVCGVAGSILPDLDVLAFRLGIPYAAQFGHRGFSHSLLFAFGAALVVACCCRWLRAGFLKSLLFMFLAISSHGLLDTLTNGGLGIALLWPWSEHRYFAPVQPIEVAPLSLARFFSERGIAVMRSELLWVWAPALALAGTALVVRRLVGRQRMK